MRVDNLASAATWASHCDGFAGPASIRFRQHFDSRATLANPNSDGPNHGGRILRNPG